MIKDVRIIEDLYIFQWTMNFHSFFWGGYFNRWTVSCRWQMLRTPVVETWMVRVWLGLGKKGQVGWKMVFDKYTVAHQPFLFFFFCWKKQTTMWGFWWLLRATTGEGGVFFVLAVIFCQQKWGWFSVWGESLIMETGFAMWLGSLASRTQNALRSS